MRRSLFFVTWLLSLVWLPLVTCTTGLNMTFEINEELNAGTKIADLAAESNLNLPQTYIFRIVQQYVDEMKDLVTLEENGILRTATVIDRDKVCIAECRDFKFEVIVSYSGSYQFIAISLVIKDVNDNTPTFEPNKITRKISELRSVGDEIIQLTPATDLDAGKNSEISYELSPSPNANDSFRLDVMKDNNNEIVIVLVKELDHETKASYELLILARDAGEPVRTGTLTVTIEVLDENDNKPVFVNSVLNITVTEDIAVGKVIEVLSATDKDSGDNGKVVYHLAERQPKEILESFTVDNTTGALTVAKNLVFEAGKSDKVIYVVASDMGDPPKSSQATVYLSILDAGNNPPKIFLTYLKTRLDENVIQVTENASIGEAVVHVNVDDNDPGNNGNVTCQTYNTYFGIQEATGLSNIRGYKIFVQHRLDYELNHEHNVTVTCVDGGDLSSSVNFLVKVKDENDETPQFTESIYRKTMEENNEIGAEILTVSAEDKDSGDNAKISYLIVDEYQDEFEVNEFSGVVKAKVRLDGDQTEQIFFKVRAVDHGNPVKSSEASVILTLLDVNDMAPEFSSDTYHFEVRENSATATPVDQVTVFDQDKGENKRVTCYLLPQYQTGETLEVPFTVMDDGRIYTNTELDREEKSSYSFEVGARDHGTPPLSSTVQVYVKVTDVNDEKPYFVFPSKENNSVVAFNEVSDIAIAQVHAKDNDIGINQELIYFIVQGNDDGIFYLNDDSGKLYIHKYVPLSADQRISLYLSVYDKGQPAKFSTEYLHVTLQYSNASASIDRTDNSNTYVTIVVTLVCITVALSVFIIIIICIIRKKDLHKCGREDRLKWKLPFGQGKPGTNGVVGQPLSGDKVYPSTQKNKKEVSFDIDDDAFATTEYPVGEPHKHMGRHTSLEHMPDDSLDHQPISILHSAHHTFNQSAAKFMAPQDGQLMVGHQREDSHSETSGETATSHDSGKGGSVEGDTHDASFKFEAMNPSVYLIKEDQSRSSYRPSGSSPAKTQLPKHSTLPHKMPDSSHRRTMPFSDSSNLSAKNQNRTPTWSRTLDSSSSYPDSDYVSIMGSPRNYNQAPMKNSFPDHRLTWGSHHNNNSKVSQIGHINPAYGTNQYPTYRSNSTRDDDEASTTTSGSYTINPEELDDDIAASQYQVSQVV